MRWHMSTRLAKKTRWVRVPSTEIGAAQVLDVYGQLAIREYNKRLRRDFTDDARALYGDWAMIGRDLVKATKKVSASH